MRKENRSIKSTLPDKTGKIINKDIIEISNFKHPIFCLRYLQKGFHIDECSEKECASLARQIVSLSTLTWQQIQLAPKHGLGSEKIALSSIKAAIPNIDIITEDVDHLLAFRFHGKAPFIGIRYRFIMHILYLDRSFTLYNH